MPGNVVEKNSENIGEIGAIHGKDGINNNRQILVDVCQTYEKS